MEPKQDRRQGTGSKSVFLHILLDWRMLSCVAIGFSSGLPLYVIMQLVPAWFRLEGVSLAVIGFFTAV